MHGTTIKKKKEKCTQNFKFCTSRCNFPLYELLIKTKVSINDKGGYLFSLVVPIIVRGITSSRKCQVMHHIVMYD
jgi:hypothetical protein